MSLGFNHSLLQLFRVCPLSTLEHRCFDVVSLAKELHPHVFHFTGVNEYLVGQKWQCVRLVYRAALIAVMYAPGGIEMAH